MFKTVGRFQTLEFKMIYDVLEIWGILYLIFRNRKSKIITKDIYTNNMKTDFYLQINIQFYLSSILYSYYT